MCRSDPQTPVASILTIASSAASSSGSGLSSTRTSCGAWNVTARMWGRLFAMASKAVLITGCSTGIGRKTAEHLAQKGWTVYATARRPESIADLEQKGCRTLALDVTDEDSMQAAVSAVEQAEGAVGVLVNNAGYSQSGAVEEVPMDQVRRQFETNVFGLLRMSQLVLPGMRRQGWGRIVNISSMGGRRRLPGRRHLPRHEVRGRGDQRRDALGGPELRRRRDPDRAGADQDRVRRDGGALGERRDALGGALRRVQPAGRGDHRRRLRGARRRRGRRPSRSGSRRRSRAGGPGRATR